MDLKLLHISDTHGVHRRLRNLPEADILVHSGDFTMSGSEAETLDFLEWLCDLPYRHKVLVADGILRLTPELLDVEMLFHSFEDLMQSFS